MLIDTFVDQEQDNFSVKEGICFLENINHRFKKHWVLVKGNEIFFNKK
jgi:hypothetical protein